MGDHISQADIMTQVVVFELEARVREQERQLREQEKEIERLEKLTNSRYSGIYMIVIAFVAMVIGARLTLGIRATAGWWLESPNSEAKVGRFKTKQARPKKEV